MKIVYFAISSHAVNLWGLQHQLPTDLHYPDHKGKKMRFDQNMRALLVIVATLLGFSELAGSARGMNLYSYDLDSLIYMAHDIVEADVTGAHGDGVGRTLDVKITNCLAGRLQPNRTIALGSTFLYRKFQSEIAVGDKLILFLISAKQRDDAGRPTDTSEFVALQSGIKLVIDDNVYGFSQYNNPGGYELDGPEVQPFASRQKLSQFRDAIKAGVARTSDLRTRLQSPAKPDDIPWLLSVLKDRSAIVREAASAQLANLHDPQSLFDALAVDPREAQTLDKGFGTPIGREFLLAKIADSTVVIEQRVRLAEAVAEAGEIYRSNFSDITNGSWRPNGAPDTENSHYLTRIAKLTASIGSEDRLTVPLLNAIQRHANWTRRRRNQEIQADLTGAAEVLESAYRRDDISEKTKFHIEVAALSIGIDSLRRLKSPCGPVPSSAHLADPAKVGGPVAGTLGVDYAFMWTEDSKAVNTVQLVLQPVNGDKPYVLKSTVTGFQRVSSGIWTGLERPQLPANLPAGHYKVFYQFLADGKVVGKSYSFETKL